MLDSMLMAFSLYSRIPVPQAKWNDESMRWCICFLPLVGLVIGAAQWAAFAREPGEAPGDFERPPCGGICRDRGNRLFCPGFWHLV